MSRKESPNARRIAFDTLRAVDERDAYANLLLPRRLHQASLTGRDAALATELTYGTLRGRGTYDEVIRVCSDRPLNKIDPPVLDLLRLGAHQLLRTRIPPHAAVGETVRLARSRFGRQRTSFVNAVLRKISARDLAAWIDVIAPDTSDDPVGRLAVEYSHPRWIVSALRDALGGDMDEMRAALAADNTPAPVTLAARPGRATPGELVEAGAAPAAFSRYGAHLREGDPHALAALREGRARVQDEGSQLVTLALVDADLTGPDLRWLDMCAGPGGKAALLDGLATEREARLLAVDRQRHRARLVGEALGKRALVVVADATVPAWSREAFDRVLLDAPCTGLGSLRRRPELRWRRTPRDVAGLAATQRGLLAAAVDAVRRGGLVAYTTCSPHLAETRAITDDVMRGRDDLELLDARSALPDVPELGEGPYVQLWPHRHGTDAMFLALLRKRG